MDKLRALKYFVSVASTLNFSTTAKHFGVPSSSVSRRIKDLEAALGATLFERTTRTVQLSDLGKVYLREVASALQSIEMADELVGAQSKSPTGMLRITAMPAYGERFVIPALEKLRGQYNNIDFDVNLTDEVVNLASNDADIAIRAVTNLPDNVIARRLSDHRFLLVASPEYLSKHGAPKTSTDLTDCTVFMYRTPQGKLDWLTCRGDIWQPLDLQPNFISNYGQSILDGVLAGRGLALLPNWGVEWDIKAGRLVVLELDDGPLSARGTTSLGLYLLYHPPKFRLQKIRVAVDFLVTELGGSSSSLSG